MRRLVKWRRLMRMLLLAAAVATGAAGCGVSEESRPQALEEDSVPFELLAPAATTTTTTTTIREQPLVEVDVYLMGSQRLHPVTRRVTVPVSARKAIEALFATGVSDAELAAGLRSAINPDVDLLSVQISSDGVATVDLGEDFLDASTQEQRVALAQIVFTATGVEGTRVRFTLEGEAREVPTDRGTQAGPLGREAFAELAPLPLPAPEPAGT
jgi:hypothetical protein